MRSKTQNYLSKYCTTDVICCRHTLEINLLEEKHREQLNLHQIQISSSQQEIDNLRGKLRQQLDKRQNIAQQLRKVMEANWLEALKIINNGKSPVVFHDKSAADQLNSLKSKSYTNLEEILLLKDDVVTQQARVGNSDNVTMSESLPSMIDDSYGNKMVETPVSSRGQNRQPTDSELQKYIQMVSFENIKMHLFVQQRILLLSCSIDLQVS